VSGQLVVNSTLTAQQLVEDHFIGSGVEVSNVTLGGQTSIAQLGQFTNSNSNLALSNGIMLTTGWAQDMSISNQNFNSSFSSAGINCPGGVQGLCLAGDADLQAIVGTSTFDAAVLEFDFIPLSDTIRFRYAFASEEYNEYTCSQFNDIFAFLLNGPGYNNVNIAKIPNTNLDVRINTVNNGFVGINGSVSNCTGGNGSLNFSNLFVDNWGGNFIQFDGLTTVFEAFAIVQPCQSYHIKLAIADVIDGALDSGVFLEGNSFSSNVLDVALATPNDDSIVVEGCNTGTVRLSFEHKVNTAKNISYNILGTATNGVDYQFLSGTATIQNGQNSTTIDIIPILDNQNEGSETIILEIQKAPCLLDTVIIFINDEVILDKPIVACDTANAVSITYSWQAVNNATSYRVSYDFGATWDTMPATVLNYTIYGLTPNTIVILYVQPIGGNSVCTPHPIGSDTCSTLICNLSGQLDSVGSTTCFGGSDGYVSVSPIGGKPGYEYVLDNQTGQSSSIFTNVTGGNHVISIIDLDSCRFEIPFTINQPPPILISIDTIIPTSCSYTSDGEIQFLATNGIGNYTFIVGADTNTTGYFNNLDTGNYILVVIDDNDCERTLNFNISSPPPLILNPIGIEAICQDESNGMATVNISGGTISNHYQINWNTNQTDSIITNLNAGTYTVTVTDDNSCTEIVNVIVNEPDSISFSNIQTTLTTCFGDSDGAAQAFALGGVGNFNYLWSNNFNTPLISNLSAGNYTLTVTDGNGCKDSLTVTVDEPDELIAIVNAQNITCYGEANGSASVTLNQSGTFNYIWFPEIKTTATVTDLDTGWHYVLVTNQNGCTAIDSFIIEQPAELIAMTQEIQGASCFEANDGQATAFGSGGTPFANGQYLYSWNSTPPQSGQTAFNLQGGYTYQVAIVDSLGCQRLENITISQPDSISGISIVQDVDCYNGNNGSATLHVSGGTPSYQYHWSNNTYNASVNNLSAGVYFVTITDLNNCTQVIDVKIGEPIKLSLILLAEDVDCKGESTGSIHALVTGGTPNYSFEWNINENGSSIQNIPAGDYSLTVTDDNGCLVLDSVLITEPATLVSATFETQPVTCFGGRDGQIQIFATGGEPTYQYSTDGVLFDNAANKAGLAARDYTLIVRDYNGCVFEVPATIEEPDEMLVDAGEDVSIIWGDSYELQAISKNAIEPINYKWTPSDGLSCTDCPNPIATPIQDMFYTIQIEDARGCRAKDLVAIRLTKSHIVYVANAFTPNHDGINDFLFVQSASDKVKTVLRFEVFSRWGNKVFEARDFAPNISELGWNGRFKGELMNTGVFGWVLEVEFLDGDIEVYKGNSTLIGR